MIQIITEEYLPLMLFTKLNNRLCKWVSIYNHIGESQAGFRKGYSQINNMFTLHANPKIFIEKSRTFVYHID